VNALSRKEAGSEERGAGSREQEAGSEERGAGSKKNRGVPKERECSYEKFVAAGSLHLNPTKKCELFMVSGCPGRDMKSCLVIFVANRT
jgi:hypothetical protein